MSAAETFALANTAIVPGWLLLILAPRWRWTHRFIVLLVMSLGVAYAALFLTQFGRVEGGYGSLEQVARLFGNPFILSAGWTHFLAFDLFIGSCEVRDAGKVGVPHVVVVPCLLLTFLFGPVGLLLYLVVRIARARTLNLDYRHV